VSDKDLLRVLTIFDESEPAEQLIKVLRNAGEIVRDIRVEDDEDMEKAISENPLDIILAKQKLPIFSAQQALELLQKSGRDIPLVVITDADNSKAPLAELKAGARDAVSANQPERLLHIVKREVADLKNRKGLRRTEQMLHESEKRARTLIDSSRDAISYIHDGMHIYANHAYMDMFGYESLDDVEGMPILDMVGSEDHGTLKDFLRNYAKGQSKDDSLNIKAKHTDGHTFETAMEFSPASMEGESCTQIIIRDRANSKELEEQLNVLSKQDLLTGLFNRTYFLDKVDKLITQAVEGKTEGAVLFIEIDKFDDIRNSIGIANADQYLANIANLLKEKLDNHGLLARFEGPVFTLLLNKVDMKQAEQAATSIVKLVGDHTATIAGKVVDATVSIGLTPVNETVSNLQDCITRAESGCEAARTEGGNQYNIYNPAMEDLAEHEKVSVWSHRIKEALRNNQFKLLYQPIVSLHGIAGGHYEVTVRMLDESGEEIPPGEFITAADQADLTKFVDRWIIANCLATMQAQTAKGQDTRFFVKLSQSTLTDAEFLPWVSELVKSFNLDNSGLIFEIDEATALNHLAQSKVMIQGLKQLKCRTALENFGKEQNTFQSMQELPVDFIKIHGALVKNLPQSVENQEAMREIANHARDANMQSIAAFVEDANSLAILWQCSVDFIQGHFLQEPTSKLDFDFDGAF
jgi:diguanylate cyclase (GGDEF)-like protein/PAS domain S-box-containing protein